MNFHTVEQLWLKYGTIFSIVNFALVIYGIYAGYWALFIIGAILGIIYLLTTAELVRRNSETTIRSVTGGSRSFVALVARLQHKSDIGATQQAFLDDSKLRGWLVLELYAAPLFLIIIGFVLWLLF